jgi:hypothetical protein
VGRERLEPRNFWNPTPMTLPLADLVRAIPTRLDTSSGPGSGSAGNMSKLVAGRCKAKEESV